MTEILILLPLLLMLLLGAATLNLLAVINGKAEIAARYSGLKLAFPNRFLYQEPSPLDAANAADVASRMEWIFYDDTLDDGKFAALGEGVGVEGDDPDVSYHKFTRTELPYTALQLNVDAWNSLFTVLEPRMQMIHGSKATYRFNFPAFPFTKWIYLPDAENPAGDPIPAMASVYAVHGDFVVLGDHFSGQSGVEAQALLLAGAGIVPVPPTAIAAFAFILFIMPILLP